MKKTIAFISALAMLSCSANLIVSAETQTTGAYNPGLPVDTDEPTVNPNQKISDPVSIIFTLSEFIKKNDLTNIVSLSYNESKGIVEVCYYFENPECAEMIKGCIIENNIDDTMVDVFMLEVWNENPAAPEKITDHTVIRKIISDFIKDNKMSDVYVYDYEHDGKVGVSMYYTHPEHITMIRNLILVSNIDENEVEILVMESALEIPQESEKITDHETIIQMISDFVRENNLKEVKISDVKSTGKVTVYYMNYCPEYKQLIENFILESNIDEIEVDVFENYITYPASLKGDATCDGNIDIRDVVLISKYIVKMAELNEQALLNADADGDGIVDLKDLMSLKSYLIGDKADL